MKNYELNKFQNGKAFIYFEGNINGKHTCGNRICINSKGEKLFELPDKDMIVNDFEEEDIAFVTNYSGKYAVINNKGKFLTDFIYDSIYGGSEEGLWEVKRNGKHGSINIQGIEIIPCIYDDGCYFSEGVAAECKDNKWGMVDYWNNTVIPFVYEEICICKNNLINAKKNGKWGLIDKNNEIVVDFLYDEIDCWNTRDCVVYPTLKGNKWGLINRCNEIIEDFIYDDSQLISDNEDNAGEFIILLKGDKKAIYSTKKQGFITEFIYDYIGYLSNDRFLAIKDNKTGFVDINGETVVPFVFDSCSHNDFSEGRCVVYKNDKAGVIDLEGNVIVPFKYYKINDCSEGMIWAIDNKRNSGFLNRNGKIIIPFKKYDIYSNFNNGFSIVWDNKLGQIYIDKKGNILKYKF